LRLATKAAFRDSHHIRKIPAEASRLFLFLCRHLPVRLRRGMAGERFGVARIDQPLEQFERVCDGNSRGAASMFPSCGTPISMAQS
jgi:hypothetical protein